MDNEKLAGSEIHGFHTMHDLDFGAIMEEARSRWLRPNEIHAILCNYKHFSIHVKPVNLPKSGTIVLFDRKMLRNFRKDGHNWKKKKDGKTVKEAHEHLKVGNEERIHVYYAHGQDNTTFVRRCYWLLDKSLEHIVLVHYRETRELQGSPATPVNSSSTSASDPSPPWLLSEELDSGTDHAYHLGEKELLDPGDSITVQNHEKRLHEINTLDWDELLMNPTMLIEDQLFSNDQQNHNAINGSLTNVADNLLAEICPFDSPTEPIGINSSHLSESVYIPTMGDQVNSNAQTIEYTSTSQNIAYSSNILVNERLQGQDSFGQWITQIITDSPDSANDTGFGSSITTIQDTLLSASIDHHQPFVPEQIFTINEISPAWAFASEKTKILVTGFFHQEFLHLEKSKMLCICDGISIPAEMVQSGVYRLVVPSHSRGLVNLYMSIDGLKPISQVLNFEYCTPLLHDPIVSAEEKDKWNEFQVQMRLVYLLFSNSKTLDILSNKVSPNSLKDAKKFALKTSNISKSWTYFIKSIEENRTPFPPAKDGLFELILKNRLREWLLERVVEGSKKSSEFDGHGQGVIHLCAILGYTWAICLFAWSGLSLDFRDKHGWSALHWAAYYGREKMVGVLLSAGAKPNLVTDPTSEHSGGRTAADLASMNGYGGLAAYLSEKSLVAQFEDMSLAGNISGSLQSTAADPANLENLSEDQENIKETLAAYRTAADAAARIQVAFREHSLKQRTKHVEISNPEEEARNIVAALKIQHAFRNYETRKKKAAARIQHRFRTWKIRKDFLNMRRQVIKIQALFRGYKARRQYSKIVWSVGVLEKAILRWRLKRKGFRGLQVEAVAEDRQESDAEEEFFQASRKQAEERIGSSLERVHGMFYSKKAQEEYHRMKLAHNEAKLEFEELMNPDTDMDG